MESMSSQSEDVGDQDVQHHYLIAEGLVLLDDNSYLAVLVKSANCIVVDQANDGGLGLLVFILLGSIVINTLHAVAQLKTGVFVGSDLAQTVGRQQVEVGLLV